MSDLDPERLYPGLQRVDPVHETVLVLWTHSIVVVILDSW